MAYNASARAVRRRNDAEDSDISDADDNLKSNASSLRDLAESVAIILACGFLLHKFDVFEVMMHSNKVWTTPLYMCYLCWAAFTAIGLYMTFIVARTNPNYDESHKRHIYVATGTMVAGSVLWIIGMWPVFHIWTFLLGLAILFACVRLVTFIPSKKKKA